MKEAPVKLQKQANLHNEAAGLFGDCDRTVIACLLGMDRDDVPHWYGRPDTDDYNGQSVRRAWLLARGLVDLCFPYPPDMLADAQAGIADALPGLYYTLSGESRNRCNHVVICRDGEIVWDPSIENSGIVGPCDTGYYYIGFLALAPGVEE